MDFLETGVMDEILARNIRTYGTVGLLLVAVATRILQVIPDLSGTIPPFDVSIAIAAVLALAVGLAIAAFPRRRLVNFVRRPRRDSSLAPPDMTREVLALIPTAEKVWFSDSM